MGLFNKKKAKDNLPDTYEKEAVAIADLFLPEYEIDLSKDTTFSFPIGELGILGTAAASLIPSLRIVTETVSVNTTGVYSHDIYSGESITASRFDLDHFIPCSYVANDELWNLIPMERRLNSSKSNKLP